MRLSTYLAFHVAPLNFAFTEAILVVFHVAGCLFLFAALREIRNTPMNAVLVAWYGINPFLSSQLWWWTVGAMRIPFVLFGNSAVYFYLRYRTQRTRLSAGLVFGSMALALGFFAKGVLIPAYLAGLELALGAFELKVPATTPKRRWLLIAALGVMSLAYIVAWRAATDAKLREASLDPAFLAPYVEWSWIVFGLGTAGFLVVDTAAAPWVAAVWLLALTYCSVRERRSLVAWAVAAVLITVSICTGTSAARALAAGPLVAVEADRYYFELLPVLVLFAAVALAQLPASETERAILRKPLLRWVGAGLTAAILVMTAENSYRASARLFAQNYADFHYAKEYFDNLRSGLAGASRDGDGSLPLVDGSIPKDFVWFVPNPKSKSQLLQLMGEKPRATPPAPGAYWITDTGRMVRL
jgi:hypothetical protein